MNSYKDQLQEDYLIHFGVPGMKWGRRKARESIGSDRRKLRSEYRKEYSMKKASGQSTILGKGPHQMNLNKTNYANYRAEQALRQKYGNKAVNTHDKKIQSRQNKAIAGLVGATALATAGLVVADKIHQSNITTSSLSKRTNEIHKGVQSVISQHNNLKKLF